MSLIDAMWGAVQKAVATVAHIADGEPGREVADALTALGRHVIDHSKGLEEIGTKLAGFASKIENLVSRVTSLEQSAAGQAIVGTAEAVPVVGGVVKEAAAVLQTIDGVICPNHPDAPQTKNGCTAKGCIVGPAEQIPAPAAPAPAK